MIIFNTGGTFNKSLDRKSNLDFKKGEAYNQDFRNIWGMVGVHQ